MTLMTAVKEHVVKQCHHNADKYLVAVDVMSIAHTHSHKQLMIAHHYPGRQT
jgi:hypothetical protein